MCLECAAPVWGARYQCREAQEIVHITTPNDAHYTSGLPVTVAIVRVRRVDAPENKAKLEASMSGTSHGQKETDSTSRCSVHATRQPAKLLDDVDACVAPTTPLKCGVRTQSSDSRNLSHWLAT